MPKHSLRASEQEPYNRMRNYDKTYNLKLLKPIMNLSISLFIADINASMILWKFKL